MLGQRLMQAASDPLLGWYRLPGLDNEVRSFYARQLWDGKASVDVTRLSAEGLVHYAEICGWVLAKAHARSGPRAGHCRLSRGHPPLRDGDGGVRLRLRRGQPERLPTTGRGGRRWQAAGRRRSRRLTPRGAPGVSHSAPSNLHAELNTLRRRVTSQKTTPLWRR